MKKICLALQGGGAHGAFTWGVLDRLLDETDIEVVSISAASAGAMNAAAFKSGWVKNGAQGSRDSLRTFWEAIDGLGQLTPEPVREWFKAASPGLPMLAQMATMNPAYLAGDVITRAFSPYDINPLNINPLRPMVEAMDFDTICKNQGPSLHIAATNVRSGKIRVFEGDNVTPDAILASGALPQIYQAIEIDDPKTGKREAFWDGGFMGNPPLFPLYSKSDAPDILIVHINPISRPDIPRTADAIENRINEISFNATLLRELRAIDFVHRLIEEGRLVAGETPAPFIHSLADDETMTQLSVATKLTPSPGLIGQLFDAGHIAMDGFLKGHKKDIGKRSSCDLRAMFT